MRKFKFLAVLVVLVALAVGADFVAARLFEGKVRDAFARRLDLEDKPVVQARDFPFLLSLARERIGVVDVAAHDVTIQDPGQGSDGQGVTVTDLELDLRDVVIPHDVALGRGGTVTVERVGGRARIDQDQVERLLAAQLDERFRGAKVSFDNAGVHVRTSVEGFTPEPIPVTVNGSLAVRGGRITFVPKGVVTGNLPIPLPDAVASQLQEQVTARIPALPGGLVPERVDTEPGALVVSGHIGKLQIKT